ncbi:MAG: DNA/RNA nuclease SfsA [Pseudomonadota bacterium]
MTFDKLIPATLQRRYKRFLADVVTDSGEALTVHCPNTGAMTGCATPGSRVWLSLSASKTRKYPHTWELVDTEGGMACIHSARANAVVAEALEAKHIPQLAIYEEIRREVRYGNNSRADFKLASAHCPDCTVEVKSVTLCLDNGVGLFPDAVSVRATRHLQELSELACAGERAVILFCVFHSGIRSVQPAQQIDPAYADALARALDAGVEAMAWKTHISPAGLALSESLPVVLPAAQGDAL